MLSKTYKNHFSRYLSRTIAVLILISITTVAIGQDLIVSSKGDSIHCRITSVRSDHIRYSYVNQQSIVKTFIPLVWVVSYQEDYFSFSEIDFLLDKRQERIEENRKKEIIQIREKAENRQARGNSWMISAGYSKRVDNLKNRNLINDQLEYLRKLQSGWNIGADISFPFSRRNAISIKYSGFFSSHADKLQTPNGLSDHFKTTIGIHYLAPVFNVNLPNADSTRAIMLGFGFGYLRYRECARVEPAVTYSGDNLGFCMDFGYDFALRKPLSPFARLSINIGNIHKAKIKQGNDSVSGRLRIPDNLSRIDLSVGLRFHTKKK